ncbi:hypothetical protein HMI54_015014 [Coelomomyces lativittatus]|nr:hypothetical protein HMI56_002153 [Coelomomyces lativittatus]KAJ1513423.1 hypothetical protein HMI54_015014 [Coelomomyces lativittatus]
MTLTNLIFPESERVNFDIQFKQRQVVALLDLDQTSPCEFGSVLATLIEIFKTEGYTPYLLQGGYTAWSLYQDQGLPSPTPATSPTDPSNSSSTPAFKRTTSFLLKTNQLKPIARPAMTPTLEEPSQILDWLYLGPDLFTSNIDDAIKLMKSLNVSAILNMTFEVNPMTQSAFPIYKQIACQDTADEKIEEFLDPATEFIENVRLQGKTIYVHCKAGVSRSATVVLAYLVRYQKMPLEDAHRFLRSKRPVIAPNIGFLSVLKEYAVVNQK